MLPLDMPPEDGTMHLRPLDPWRLRDIALELAEVDSDIPFTENSHRKDIKRLQIEAFIFACEYLQLLAEEILEHACNFSLKREGQHAHDGITEKPGH